MVFQGREPLPCLTMEDELHYRVISFVKRCCTGILLCAGLGELCDTKEKGIDARNKGYTKGEPDIKILNLHARFSGFCIELKAERYGGILSESQSQVLKRYKLNGYKTLVSDDYDLVVVEIMNYMSQTRAACLYCSRKFKSEETLNRHVLCFHRK